MERDESFWREGDLVTTVIGCGYAIENVGRVREVIIERGLLRVSFYGRDAIEIKSEAGFEVNAYMVRLIARVEDTESDEVFELRLKELSIYKSILEICDNMRSSDMSQRLIREYLSALHAVQHRMTEKGARLSVVTKSTGEIELV